MQVLQNQIIHGDFYKELPKLKMKSVDMILTDLPYNITQNEWEEKLDLYEMWSLFNHVLKDNGLIVLTSNQPFTTDLINSNRKNFKYDIIWDKILVTGHLNAKKQPLRKHEEILVFGSNGIYNPQRVKGNPTHSRGRQKDKPNSCYGSEVHTNNINDMKYPTSIIQIQKIQSGKTLHPTQKPIELFEYLIKTYTNDDDLVLDCCAGSGTTAEACINTNRNYICIEKNEEYFNIMQDRISSRTTKQKIGDSE